MRSTRYLRSEYHKLPSLPGVYLFYNKLGNLIYVGKAKELKKRVGSYFNKLLGHSAKVDKMVSHIDTIGFTLVNNEHEALMLESNLIKRYEPRYNACLKDDKSYPYLCMTKGPFPRLIVTRQKELPLGNFFGPFTNRYTLERIQDLIRELYPLRSCNYRLSEKNIRQKKFKVCLEYHIGKCLGPCAGLQSEENYKQDVKQVEHLLRGNFQAVKKVLKTKMLAAAKAHDFLKAQAYKEKLQAINEYQGRSIIIQPKGGDVDVLAVVGKDQYAFVSYIYVKKGMMIFAQTVTVEKKLDEAPGDIAGIALLHFREKAESEAVCVVSNVAIPALPKEVQNVIPKLGQKRKLVELAIKNALFFQREKIYNEVVKSEKEDATLRGLQQDLNLPGLPKHIECFDNSNLQGSSPVAGMVCFKNGRAVKREHRHFHIKTVVGIDDFASMQEVVERRYSRLVAENKPLPDLIVIDGGKGQLGAAIKGLKAVGVYEKVSIIAIAKKLEIIYSPGNPYPLYINKRSPSLKFLQRVRNAAHDFAVNFHRATRSKRSLHSQLQAIPSIGPKTIEKLLMAFGSLKHLKKASTEELIPHVGRKKALVVQEHLRRA